SVRPGASQDEFRRGDAILNVETLAEVGRRLGPDVTEVAIPGGLHDLVLSAPKVRENVYREIFSWLTSHVKPK
ncbi:MAG: alpha/beta hydrolase, partial [Muribaculaceae bacterium]|nr:alpha/beta hydrolase [Muribaculaceae bacterium]